MDRPRPHRRTAASRTAANRGANRGGANRGVASGGEVGRSAVRVIVALIAAVVAPLAALGSALLATPLPAAADWVRDDQWQLDALDVGAAWRHSAGAGVTVAVLDSGVDAHHPDLAGQVLPGIDLVDGRTTDGRTDPVGHGTTVAALIAGRDDDTAGVVGIAPKAKILPVRVLDTGNKYDDATIVARGLRWAVDRGATVVNLSLGGPARSDELAEALAYAAARDVVVIACTGNLGAESIKTTEVWYPAREPGVVAVAGLAGPRLTAVSAADQGRTDGHGGTDTRTAGAARAGNAGRQVLWSGSLTGPQTVLAAPAVNLLGARPGGYWRVQGTSFAAPLVTAVATLIRSRWPDLSAPNVINRLVRTAHDLGPAGRDDRYGYGQVDPIGALTATVAEVAGNPLVPALHAHPTDSLVPLAGAPASTADHPDQTDQAGQVDRAGRAERDVIAGRDGSADRGPAAPDARLAFGAGVSTFGSGLLLVGRLSSRRWPRAPYRP